MGAMWLPYPNNLTWPFGSGSTVSPIFPLNDPAWSLFFEAFVNIVFFFYVYRFRKLTSVQIVGIAFAIYIAISIIFNQVNPGWGRYNFIFGFPRVVAEFFAGVLIYQFGLHKKTARPKLTLFVGGAMACVLVGLGDEQAALVNSLTLIPLIVVLSSAIKIESQVLIRTCKMLGNISYPLYIVHFPIYRLLWQIPQIQALAPILQTALMSCLCILLSLLLAVLDEHLRRSLTARAAFASQRSS
jgi:peptidoglycan/LPS O-acetylase OafA/YrhL